MPTTAVGSITTPKVAEEILQKGQATLIFPGASDVGRPVLAVAPALNRAVAA